MPENAAKPKQLNGSELAQQVLSQINTVNTSGSIHNLIQIETQALRQRVRRQITNNANKYEAQPLGELMRLSEERNKALKNLQR
tara:strand:+ start:176 stop:427 length:252 start_codon:yes stop_codon:yes gene_type:complete